MTRGAWVIIGVFLWHALPCAASAEEASRPYRDGPLTKDDFRATPDQGVSYHAWTKTDFRYRYNYRYNTQGGETTATLSEVEVWGVVVRDQSWNRRPSDALLLDHEQGHFDITQIHALEAEAALRKRMKSGPKLQGKATTQAAAVKQLEDRLQATVQPYMTDSIEAHRQYDKATDNGQDAAAQATARREHRQRFEALLGESEKSLEP